MTEGQALRQLREKFPHKYFIKTTAYEIWFYDHITTLIRTMQDEKTMCAYSGRLWEDSKKFRRTEFFRTLDVATACFYHPQDHIRIPGQFLFDAACHASVPDFLFDCLDGLEHSAYLNIVWHKYKKIPAFSKRMTLTYIPETQQQNERVVPYIMQIRFIQDLVKYDLPTANTNHIPTVQNIAPPVRKMFIGFPIKLFIKMRFYQNRFWKTNGKAKEKYLKYFEDARNKFLNLLDLS
jgi:hypothetical protein